MPDSRAAASCLMVAWAAYSGELKGYLRHRCASAEDAEELLQDVFIRALRQGQGFCAVNQPRAWFFQVTRNALADHLRCAHPHQALPDDLATEVAEEMPAIDSLSQCLPRVLRELSAVDRQAITFCDIEGRSQQAYAVHLSLSLSAAKSRVQRARQRLKLRLEKACQVRFDESGTVCGYTPRQALSDSP